MIITVPTGTLSVSAPEVVKPREVPRTYARKPVLVEVFGVTADLIRGFVPQFIVRLSDLMGNVRPSAA